MINVILFSALNKQSCKQAWSLVFFIFFVSKGYRSEAIGYVIAELLASGALWLRKFGYDVAYEEKCVYCSPSFVVVVVVF